MSDLLGLLMWALWFVTILLLGPKPGEAEWTHVVGAAASILALHAAQAQGRAETRERSQA